MKSDTFNASVAGTATRLSPLRLDGATTEQLESYQTFRAFADSRIAPLASSFDLAQCIPAEALRSLAEATLFASVIPERFGGRLRDPLTYGLLHEVMGQACTAVSSLITVHDMVASALVRWGSDQQRLRWLPELAAGNELAAFCISEAEAGSDIHAVQTTARRVAGGYVLTGNKRWITGGQVAGLFLVIARGDDGIGAYLVPRITDGVTVSPIVSLLGARASMLADVRFDGAFVAAAGLLGPPGAGLSHVASSCLDHGRYCVAWASVGILQACLDESREYTGSRSQGGQVLARHQLVARMLSDMITHTTAARLLCCAAGRLRATGDPDSMTSTCIAKYFSARAAFRAASDAVQIQGARGCLEGSIVGRCLRDAKIMEIIEGSNEIQQQLIASAYCG